MRLGFILNQETCIGCHACTVACKSEHRVPLGAFRTWVKYIERGEFPDVQRRFSVMRCNHCDDAPCIAICPTKALFRRPDGVVDFDGSACIGCKSCMQACPYDALYIDPETHTAAKCNFCAHRIDAGLEPACVIVCPVQAIGVVDLDAPGDAVTARVAEGKLVARKPELGTKPKTFYIGADPASLDPLLITDRGPYPFATPGPAPEGEPGAVREIYDVDHPAPWGWKVWSYLWTKSIAAGILFVGAILGLSVPALSDGRLVAVAAPATALIFIAITALLLVFDLKRPERFWYMLTRPNFRSWLVWGSVALTAFGGLAAAWLATGWAKADDLRQALLWPAIPVALFAAGYTAFLFRQALGREFWVSKLLLPDLLAQAVAAGGAAATILLPMLEPDLTALPGLARLTVAGLAIHLALVLFETAGRHGSPHVRRAAAEIRRGTHRRDFRVNVLLLGGIAAAALLLLLPVAGEIAPSAGLLGSLLALWGLYRYERMWILAGQAVPLS
jgi:Fe-S-cluster-containing dehydrogenase component/formate-dependent nitrite reductase membrane component NrfD